MKYDVMLTNDREFDGQAGASLATLDKIQRGLLVALGSILTYVVLTFSSAEPFFDFDIDTIGAIVLWLILLLAPATLGLVIYKLPSWQNIPLALRKNVILQSLGLSVLTLGTTILFFLKWNPYQPGNWLFCAFVTVCYGAIIVWLHFRLARKVADENGELFP